MYRTDFWTLWEKARVGCFERTACILSRVKQITSPAGMHETSAQTWCTGKTQRNRVEREVGGGIGMGNTCNSMAHSYQCMTKTTEMLWSISLQLIKINEKKKDANGLKTMSSPVTLCELLSHVRLFVACQSPLSVDFSGKITGVSCHFLLQGIIPTQGLNLGLLPCRQILYHLSHQGSPVTLD